MSPASCRVQDPGDQVLVVHDRLAIADHQVTTPDVWSGT
jgi:hypothetical protein